MANAGVVPADLSRRVRDYVRSRPGRTCAEIARVFGTTPARMGVELRELRAAGRIVSRGAKRGTRYYADARDATRVHREAGA